MDINTVRKYYENAGTKKLLELSEDLKDLDQEAFPLLFEEFKKRGEKEAAEKVKAYFYNPTKEKTFKELQEEVAERFASGEPIDSIKGDFGDRGINFQEIMSSFVNHEERVTSDKLLAAAEAVLLMQSQNVPDDLIKNHLAFEGIKEHYVDEIIEKTHENIQGFAEELTQKFKLRRKTDLILGPIVASLSIIGTAASMTIRGLSSIEKTMPSTIEKSSK